MTRGVCLSWLVFVACGHPDTSGVVQDAVLHVSDGAIEVEDAFVAAFEEATTSLHVAIPEVGDALVFETLLTRWEEQRDNPDFTFELIVDVDDQNAAGVRALLDAGAPVRLSNNGIAYEDFAVNRRVSWSSDQAIMSHAYAIVDRRRVVTANTAGDLRTGPRLWFELRGEDLLDDLLAEHNQVFGGVDATATTAFNAPSKSIADFRWHYLTSEDHTLEMWFGPQERPAKRMIDAVYSARSNIWIMADEIANDGLARALAEKARWGFDVRVVVGPGFGSQIPELSDALVAGATDIQLVRVDSVDRLPTLLLVDLEPDREGFSPHARGMVLTHELVSSSRLYDDQEVPTDQFIDGALWVVDDRTDDRASLAAMSVLYQDLFDQGMPL